MNKEKDNKNMHIRILSCFTIAVMIVTALCIYNTNNRIDKILLAISIIGQLVTLYGCYYSNKYVTEIGHCIFGMVVLFITFIGQSKCILFVNSVLLSLTLLSREYLGNCMFNYDENSDITVTKLYPNLNWTMVYWLFLIISVIRLSAKLLH